MQRGIHKPNELIDWTLNYNSKFGVGRYLQQGVQARTTSSVKTNERSSRSHALFTILIHDVSNKVSSKFHFIDLAGSEKYSNNPAVANEGIDIKVALLNLGRVVEAIVKKKSHIPFRDSKLTLLLRDSLGGNSHTLLIACVSPNDIPGTKQTLEFAERVRYIENNVVNKQKQRSTHRIVKSSTLAEPDAILKHSTDHTVKSPTLAEPDTIFEHSSYQESSKFSKIVTFSKNIRKRCKWNFC